MRRSDREITDPVKIREIMTGCHCCRLGLCDGGRAYVVPLNFGLAEENGRCALYFHGAEEGRKIDLIRKTGWASFEMDRGYELAGKGGACTYSARFQCVMGGGPVTLLETAEEKRRGLAAIMSSLTGRDGWSFDEAVLEKTAVFRLDVEEISCKVHE